MVVDRVTLHSNLEQQSAYVGVALPGNAGRLVKACRDAGWDAKVGWSSQVWPAGFRESAHHKAVEEAHIRLWCGVQCAAYGSRAMAVWVVALGRTTLDSVTLQTRRDGWRKIGLDKLVAHIRAEGDE